MKYSFALRDKTYFRGQNEFSVMREGYVRDFRLLRVQQVIAYEVESHMKKKNLNLEMIDPSWRRAMIADEIMGAGLRF